MGLFLARAYGVAIEPSSLFSLALTIVLLSLGAPGVPGAGLVCLSVVLGQLNVPVEAIGLVIAIDPILDMFITMSNTTGDMMTALVVARSEKILDVENTGLEFYPVREVRIYPSFYRHSILQLRTLDYEQGHKGE